MQSKDMASEDKAKAIDVEVAYATPAKQKIIKLSVPVGTSAYDAVIQSGITGHFDDIDPDKNAMGIFSKPLNGKGRPLPKEYRLEAGDRVEIYRPLQIDPKQARLQRAGGKEGDKAGKKSGK